MKAYKTLLTICILVIMSCLFMLGTEYSQDIIIENSDLECNQDQILSSLETMQENNYAYYESNFNALKLKKTNCDSTYYLELPEDRDKLYMTLDYVARARKYDLDVYDCTEKAELLAILLKELGYRNAKTKHVNVDCDNWSFSESYTYEQCKSNNGGHLIVQVGSIYFEATSGRIIMPEEYLKYSLN